MPMGDSTIIDLTDFPPYDKWRQCPKCLRNLRIIPGDRFRVLDELAPNEEAPRSLLVTECPNCRSEIAILLSEEESERMQDAVIQIRYEDYDRLVRAAERFSAIDWLIDREDEFHKLTNWIGERLEELDDTMRSLRQPSRRDDRDDDPPPRRRRDERDEAPRTPPRRVPVDPWRGNVDPEREEALMGGIITRGGSERKERGTGGYGVGDVEEEDDPS